MHSYSQIRPTTSFLKEEALDPEAKVEMVTVPAMGAEWGKDEMHQMTKAGKKERKNESRAQFWKSWNRGERGLCGHYFTRKVLVFFLFGLCCVYAYYFYYYSIADLGHLFRVALILGFTIPRVPSFSFNTANPLVNATGAFAKAVPTIFSRSPTNFSFPAFAFLQVDTSSNFLPVRFTYLRATVYDLDSNLQVGSGSYSQRSLPAQSFPELLLPLNFTYVTSNTSDQTCQCLSFIMVLSPQLTIGFDRPGTDWYDACRNSQFSPNRIRPCEYPNVFSYVL